MTDAAALDEATFYRTDEEVDACVDRVLKLAERIRAEIERIDPRQELRAANITGMAVLIVRGVRRGGAPEVNSSRAQRDEE